VAFLHWVLVLVGLYGIFELGRRSRLFTGLMFFVLPFALIPLFLSNDIDSWFRWVKLYSVVFGVIWVTLYRFTGLRQASWPRLVVALILIVNILEAVAQDLTSGTLATSLNAVAGVLCIVGLANWKSIIRDENAPYKDIIWPGMSRLWIVAYLVWNWNFVYGNFPENAMFHVMVLAACTIPGLLKPGLWIEARAYTLGGWMIYSFAFPAFVGTMSIALPRPLWLALALSALSLALNAATVVQRLLAARARRGSVAQALT